MYVGASDETCVRNALHLLEGYVKQEMKNEMPVHIYSAGIELNMEDCDYPHTEQKQAAVLPLGIFQAAPPKGGVIQMNIQAQSENTVSFVFTGSTYNFRSKFDAAGAPGAWMNPEAQSNEERGPYLRTLKDIDVSTESGKASVAALLTDSLGNLCMRVAVDGTEDLEEDCPTVCFIKELRSRLNYDFI